MPEPPDGNPTDQQETPRQPAGASLPHEVELEDLLQRRVPTRIRLWQGAGLVVVLLVLAALIGRSLTSTADHPRTAVPSPTPLPLGPVLVLSNVSFGTLTLNGQRLSTPPATTALRRGTNTFVLTAPPFRPLTCQVRWPDAELQGPCDLQRDVSKRSAAGSPPRSYVAVVELWLSGDDLPTDVLARALDDLTATLRAVPLTTTVPAGEYIGTGAITDRGVLSERVTEPWQANLTTTATSLNFTGDEFCGSAGCVAAMPSVRQWVAAASVNVQWEYAPQSAPRASHTSVAHPAWSLRLILTLDAQGAWHLDQQSTERLNGFGLDAALPAMACRAGTNYLDTVRPGDQLDVSVVRDQGLEGCTLQLTDLGGGVRGSFIWRFGVLLAADAPAHSLLPDLPVAPASAFAALGEPVPPGL